MVGQHTNLDIINQILSKKRSITLYWYSEDGEYPICTPIYDLNLLSVKGGKEVISPFLNSIKTNYYDTGDWITENMPSILANFGIDGFDEI